MTTSDYPWGTTSPSRAEFVTRAASTRVIPVVRRLLGDTITPTDVYRRLAGGRPGTFLMESAQSDGQWSNWSFIGVNSQATLLMQDGHATWHGDVPVGLTPDGPVLELIREALDVLASPATPGLPPLTGGLVGALGWDVVYEWEPTLRRNAPADTDLPTAAMCLATDLVAVDRRDSSVWLIACAVNTDGSPERVDEAYHRCLDRLEAMQNQLLTPTGPHVSTLVDAPTHAATSPTSDEEYEAAVLAAKQAVYDGEVFQAVLSKRFDLPYDGDPLDVYRILRTVNPSPYMYLMSLDDGAGSVMSVVGSSPETLVKVTGSDVVTYPIAGSRPRGATPQADAALGEELLADPKELSEHVMLLDLARNDLSKICDPQSIEVAEYMEVKRYSHIMHISSTVVGQRKTNTDALDCLTATFPAGTLSGAPKPRAIELIDDLEPARRGLYGGVVGYFDFAGDADFAITIRTAVIANGEARIQSGAGIVADSEPETERLEVTNKAAAVARAITLATQLHPITSATTAPSEPEEGRLHDG